MVSSKVGSGANKKPAVPKETEAQSVVDLFVNTSLLRFVIIDFGLE